GGRVWVGCNVPPEPFDHSAHLVAERLPAVRRADEVLELAAPDVEVRPADPAARDPDQRGVRLDLRNGVLPDVEVGAELRHDGKGGFHARVSSFVPPSPPGPGARGRAL